MLKSCSLAIFGVAVAISSASVFASSTTTDSDRDGLGDALEAALLKQFAPQFLVSNKDCSARPAAFISFESRPIVESESGTIYGQVFPRAGHPDQVELHYYHLWRRDCGDMGHSLDAEHVSALVSDGQDGNWKALYWYAAAHEDTICDASQIARASALDTERRGPQVWISRGKHGSFLSNLICKRGCGSDECDNLEPLAVPEIINLGEPAAPAGGATWVEASQWPLAVKMRRSDFAKERIARADRLSGAIIVWAHPQKRPYQAAIHGGNDTAGGVATGARATDSALMSTDAALDVANVKTGFALAGASRSTGNSLAKSYAGVKKALGTTFRKMGGAVGGRSSGK